MTTRRVLVVDTNILMRGVLGLKVLTVLQLYEDKVVFCAPDICFDEARRNLPEILNRRGINVQAGLLVLDEISRIVESVPCNVYRHMSALPESESLHAILMIGP